VGAGLGRLQATTIAHRLLRLAGRERAPVEDAGPPVGSGAREVADAGSAGAEGAGPSGPGLPPDVRARALAAGGSPDAVVGLADVWAALGVSGREAVARPLGRGDTGPLRLGGHLARQTDETTCGSAVLTMLAAAGDPFLALWLVTGRLAADGSGGLHRPPELRGAGEVDLAVADAGERFGAVQRAVKRASTRGALGPFPWPGALGTPPWAAARTARYPGVTFTSLMVDDTDTGHLAAVLDRADAALASGLPVPLYTGGDLAHGLTTAVPRHVVLLVPRAGDHRGRTSSDPPGYAVYEPASGLVHRLTRDEVLAPSGPRAALGGWSHVCWVLLPRP
jgi:hypothetical protein